MPKIDETTKQQRLDRISLLLRRHTLGVTQAEIANEVGLEPRTTNNYLRELEDQGKAYKDGIYWFPLALKETQLRPFELSPEEATKRMTHSFLSLTQESLEHLMLLLSDLTVVKNWVLDGKKLPGEPDAR